MRILKLIFAMISCCFLITSFPSTLLATSGENNVAELYLERTTFEDGVAEVSLMLDSSSGMCGLLAVLEYDESSLVLVSCGVADVNANVFNLTFRDDGGNVIFLIDGKQNSASKGALASFYFRLIDEDSDRGQVTLLPISDGCAFYLDIDREPKELELRISEDSVNVCDQDTCDIVTDASVARLRSVSAELGVGELTLKIVGVVTGKNHFASGFKIFAVDMKTARTSTTIVARVINGENIELSVSVPFDKRVCIIITPISYNGREISEGEKSVSVFE